MPMFQLVGFENLVNLYFFFVCSDNVMGNNNLNREICFIMLIFSCYYFENEKSTKRLLKSKL